MSYLKRVLVALSCIQPATIQHIGIIKNQLPKILKTTKYNMSISTHINQLLTQCQGNSNAV